MPTKAIHQRECQCFNFTVDGVSDMTPLDYTIHYEPNMDAVQEVRVLTTNFEANSARNFGALSR